MKAGDIYRHYKGYNYEIMAIALMEKTLEQVVVYKPFVNELDFKGIPKVWVRPLKEFEEKFIKVEL